MRPRLHQIDFDSRSTPPENPLEGEVYLDDGTNTESGTPGFRRWNGTAWADLGIQSADDIDPIDAGAWA